MGAAINEADFADPISRRLARGESVAKDNSMEIWLDPHGLERHPITNGGIIDPQRRDIPRRTRLYRFASTHDGVEGTIAGGWWVAQPELERLVRYAEVNGKTLGYAVRLLCCVPPEWGSALNFLVAVRTAADIAAWGGLAGSAVGRSSPKPGMPGFAARPTRIDARNDVAALRVPQLFIPGTRRPGAAKAMFHFEGCWQTNGAKDWIVGSGG